MAITFSYSESTLGKNLDKVAERAGAVVLLYAGTKAQIIESDMKVNRPWNDRTGAAKAELRTAVTRPEQDIVRITLAHGVNYGIFLELAHEKKNAIIAPTIDKFAPEVVEDLQGIFGEMV